MGLRLNITDNNILMRLVYFPISKKFQDSLTLIKGSFTISLFCFLLLMVSRMDGSSTRLVMRDMISVSEINMPNAAVPPKLDMANIEKPKNRITVE